LRRFGFAELKVGKIPYPSLLHTRNQLNAANQKISTSFYAWSGQMNLLAQNNKKGNFLAKSL